MAINHSSYLSVIPVTALAFFSSSQRKFYTGDAKKTVLIEVHPERIKANPEIVQRFYLKIINRPSQYQIHKIVRLGTSTAFLDA